MRAIRSLVLLLVAVALPVLLPTGAYAADGDFIRVYPDDPNGPVYRMVGGAPVYVSTWPSVGATNGPLPYTDVSQAYFDTLPPYPADGAVANDGVNTYRWAGGAPIVVTSWANIDGEKPSIRIDPRAIAEAGTARWSRLRQQPLDGTLIVGRLTGDPENGAVFVMAGGAPIYVATWDGIGGVRPSTVVDMVAIRSAGNGQAPYNHLSYRPAEGTLIHTGTTCYRITGGAPLPIGAGACGTRVDPQAITNAGQPGKWSHLNAPPPPPPPPPPPAPAPVPAPTVRTVGLKVIKKSRLKVDIGPNAAGADYEFFVEVRKRRKWRTLVGLLTTGPRDVKRVNLPRGKYRVVLPEYPGAPAVTSRVVKIAR